MPFIGDRRFALARKNYLLQNSGHCGEQAAAIYSPVGTAKLNGVSPQMYLT